MARYNMTRGIYAVRKTATRANDVEGVNSYALGLPRAIGDKLYGRLFRVELIDEGILYRPVGPAAPDGEDMPDWADS